MCRISDANILRTFSTKVHKFSNCVVWSMLIKFSRDINSFTTEFQSERGVFQQPRRIATTISRSLSPLLLLPLLHRLGISREHLQRVNRAVEAPTTETFVSLLLVERVHASIANTRANAARESPPVVFVLSHWLRGVKCIE